MELLCKNNVSKVNAYLYTFCSNHNFIEDLFERYLKGRNFEIRNFRGRNF